MAIKKKGQEEKMSVDINWTILTSSSSSSSTGTSSKTSEVPTGRNDSGSDNEKAATTTDGTRPSERHDRDDDDDDAAAGAGDDVNSLAESVRDFLDARFQQIALPPFLRAVHVTAFDFGHSPPEIEVRDVCEPLGEFYEEDGSEDSGRGGDGDGGGDDDDDVIDGRRSSGGGEIGEKGRSSMDSGAEAKAKAKAKGDEIANENSVGKAGPGNALIAPGEGVTTAAINRLNLRNLGLPPAAKSSAIGASLPSPFSDFHFAGAPSGGLNTPQLSVAGTHTPGIPGGASNLGYFHLPLSAGLSGAGSGVVGTGLGSGSVATTPLLAATGMSKGVGVSAEMQNQQRFETEKVYHENLRQHQRRQNRELSGERGDVGAPVSPAGFNLVDRSKKEQIRVHQQSNGRKTRRGRRRDGTANTRVREDKGRRNDHGISGSSSSDDDSDESDRDSSSDDSSFGGTLRTERKRRHRKNDSYSSNSAVSSSNISLSAGTSASLIPGPRETSPNDIQVVAHVHYSGDVRISLTAEIILDYPMQSFVAIPLKLNITGLVFDGTAVLAYVHPSRRESGRPERKSKRGTSGRSDQRTNSSNGRKRSEEEAERDEEQDSKRVHFCFLAHEDAHALYPAVEADIASDSGSLPAAAESADARHKQSIHSDDRGATSSTANNASPIFTTTTRNNNSSIQVEANDNNSLLRALRIESEIGQGENGKQVLKNVGKVERFVLEQVRRVFEEELVFPSHWTFLV